MPKIIKEMNGISIFSENRLPFGDSLPLLSDSRDVLVKMKGRRISGISKMVAKPLSRLADGPLQPGEVFSRAPGPIFIFLEGNLCFGFCPSHFNHSVLIWEEEVPFQIASASRKCAFFENGFLIDSNDDEYGSVFAASFVGQTVENVTIIKVSNEEDARFLNERGLRITVGDGRELLISLMLVESDGNFLLSPTSDMDAERFTSIQTIMV